MLYLTNFWIFQHFRSLAIREESILLFNLSFSGHDQFVQISCTNRGTHIRILHHRFDGLNQRIHPFIILIHLLDQFPDIFLYLLVVVLHYASSTFAHLSDHPRHLTFSNNAISCFLTSSSLVSNCLIRSSCSSLTVFLETF